MGFSNIRHYDRALSGAMLMLLVDASVLQLPGCRRGERKPPAPIKSTDGKYTIQTFINDSRHDPTTYLCVGIVIRDERNAVAHIEQTGASSRMRWQVAWDEEGRAWLKSSDIGTSYWEREANGVWKKYGHTPGTKPIPPF